VSVGLEGTVRETRQNGPEDKDDRKHLEERLPRYPDRPAYMAVRAAFIERFAQLKGLLTEQARQRSSESSEDLSYEPSVIEALDSDCSRLATCLFADSHDPVPLRAARYDARLGPRDWRDPSVIKFLRRHLRRWKQPKGRPPTLLPIALRALDLRLTDRERWSWNVLQRELCQCKDAASDAKHKFRCRENIRREVHNLHGYLGEMGVNLPTPGR
jgi:hypothetical protein